MARGDKDKPKDIYESGKQNIKETRLEISKLSDDWLNLGANIESSLLKAVDANEELNGNVEQTSNNYGDINDNVKKLLGNLQDVIDKHSDINKSGKDHEKSLEIQNSLVGTVAKKMGNVVNKIDESGKLSQLLTGNFKDLNLSLELGLMSIASFVNFVVDGVGKISKLQTEFNKTLGLSDKAALALRGQMGKVALETNNVSINSLDIQKAFMELNAQFGTAGTTLRQDIVAEMATLGKLTNMSAEAQGRFASSMMRSGMAAGEVTKQSRRAVVNAENEYGVRLDINSTLEEAGKITGIIAANLGYNIVAISGAVAKAKQFGMTLQGLASISGNLLNFQESIGAELQAELFIGRDLNLERARLAALTGDYATLTEEIKANAGSELEFAQMNVLEKQKLAAALGMSADEMADMVYNQSNLAELSQQARNIGDDELANMLEKRNIQEQFNDLVEKLQMTFLDMANGPLGTIGNIMTSLLDSAGAFYGLMTLVAGFKLGGLIMSMVSLVTTITGAAISAATLASALTFGVTAIAIAAGIALIIGSMTSKKSQNQQKSFATGGTIEETGTATVHAGETIIPAKGTNNFQSFVEAINSTRSTNNNEMSELLNINKKILLSNENQSTVSFDKFGFTTVKTDYTKFR